MSSNVETFKIHLTRKSRGRVELHEGKAPEPPIRPRVPTRAARLLALAHRIDGLVRSGEFDDYSQVALVAGLSRARVSQITDLSLLAPSIQERVLLELKPDKGRERYGERDLRLILREPDWDRQLVLFERMLASCDTDASSIKE
ncbi:MAG: hypothetical protein KF768_13745 [Phycisphaeraceae bacterium]|nr:hypothetical protein [Phycisphaeraceae bacterium]